MRNLKKKGFTIVELVIVIAVIAVLAAVLIPTFVNLTRKANISADTVLAKNLNTAAISASADTFEEAIAAVKESGYLLANLNAKAADCYFVWEDDSNQFLLYDLENSKVIYSNDTNYGEIDKSWCFTVSNSTVASAVESKLSNITIKKAISSVNELKQALEEGGKIYIDESVVLDETNRLEFNTAGVTIEVNLGNAQLTSNGTLDGEFPIEVKEGTVIINGGIIGAAGSGIDLDGKSYETPISSLDGTNVTINNTVFNGDNSPIQLAGAAVLNNVKVNGGYFYSRRNGQVTLNNCEVHNADVAIWVTNTIPENANPYTGTSKLIINGGEYESLTTEKDYGTVSVLNGTIEIIDGNFKSAEGHMFGIIGDTCPKIVISGGTFNGISFAKLVEGGENAWKKLCAGDHKIEISADLKTVTISK